MQTTLNGQPLDFEPHAAETALDVIRHCWADRLLACGGICGACTVLGWTKSPLCSCLTTWKGNRFRPSRRTAHKICIRCKRRSWPTMACSARTPG
ncbi:MAG: hypothetical protein R2911_24605 [Caldilineaceae bacterium]